MLVFFGPTWAPWDPLGTPLADPRNSCYFVSNSASCYFAVLVETSPRFRHIFLELYFQFYLLFPTQSAIFMNPKNSNIAQTLAG